METPRTSFAIVFEPSKGGSLTPLKSTHDANEATMAFNTALRLLRAQGIDGNLLLHKHDDKPLELLRQSVMTGWR